MRDVDVRITMSATLDGEQLRLRGFTTKVLDPATGARQLALVETSDDGGATWVAQSLVAVVVGVIQPDDAVMIRRVPKK